MRSTPGHAHVGYCSSRKPALSGQALSRADEEQQRRGPMVPRVVVPDGRATVDRPAARWDARTHGRSRAVSSGAGGRPVRREPDGRPAHVQGDGGHDRRRHDRHRGDGGAGRRAAAAHSSRPGRDHLRAEGALPRETRRARRRRARGRVRVHSAGTPHTWQNVGAEVARFVATLAPADVRFERFFVRYSELTPDERGVDAFTRIARETQGMEVLGPPLDAAAAS